MTHFFLKNFLQCGSLVVVVAASIAAQAAPSNDVFSSAQVIKGESIYSDAMSFVGATMESGEPAHMGLVPQKSLWWKWQAPRYGYFNITMQGSLLTNDVVFAVYKGTSVNALTLVSKSTNVFGAYVNAGEAYSIAAAAPSEASGDILLHLRLRQPLTSAHPVPGNLLGNPSWENTGPITQNWSSTNSIGGYYNEPLAGPVDGVNWPVLGASESGTNAQIWQDIPTVPGHAYGIRFAHRVGGPVTGCCGLAGVRVVWGNSDLGIAYIPDGENVFWHWSEFVATASNSVTRVLWENIHRGLEMDAFSVVDLHAPPTILAQPLSISSLIGATTLFSVDAVGATPLHFQWRFNGAPLTNESNPLLALNLVNATAAGGYSVVITNNFGSITSKVATLALDAPTNATILVQPYGDTVFAGGFFSAYVVAAGLAPLRFQWFFNGQALAGGTNRNLSITHWCADCGVKVWRRGGGGGAGLALARSGDASGRAATE